MQDAESPQTTEDNVVIAPNRIERLQAILEDLEQEQLLNSEEDCSDPILDILITGLHAYICSEVCAGNARMRKLHLGPNHSPLCADATIV